MTYSPPDTCSICGASFKNLSRTLIHVASNHVDVLSSLLASEGLSLPRDGVTGNVFDYFFSLQGPPGSRLPCQLCNEQFANVENLKMHYYVHHYRRHFEDNFGEKTSCPLCPVVPVGSVHR